MTPITLLLQLHV